MIGFQNTRCAQVHPLLSYSHFRDECLLYLVCLQHPSRVVLRRGGGGVDVAAVVPGERAWGVRVGGVEVVDVVLPVLLALDHLPRSVACKRLVCPSWLIV